MMVRSRVREVAVTERATALPMTRVIGCRQWPGHAGLTGMKVGSGCNREIFIDIGGMGPI
jgi:hypothetical protein